MKESEAHEFYGSVENTTAAKANHEALEKAGIKNVYYESPGTAHEWLTWRRRVRAHEGSAPLRVALSHPYAVFVGQLPCHGV